MNPDVVGLGAVAVIALALAVLGTWGRRNAGRLVPATLAPADRARQERVLRRGASAAHIAALILVVAAVAPFF